MLSWHHARPDLAIRAGQLRLQLRDAFMQPLGLLLVRASNLAQRVCQCPERYKSVTSGALDPARHNVHLSDAMPPHDIAAPSSAGRGELSGVVM